MAEYNCINCKYGNTTDDYEHCGNCDKGSEFVKMTNSDRIRSMSDEELAEWIFRHDTITYCHGRLNTEELLEWLKSEAKE